MTKINNLNSTLFESIAGRFRLSVRLNFTSVNVKTGYVSNLAYIAAKNGNSYVNPDVFLIFSFKASPESHQTSDLYTSYPQLSKFRETFKELETRIKSDAFLEMEDGSIIVNPKYENLVLSELGKHRRWISFGLGVEKKMDNNIVTYEPIITVEISTAEGEVSVLNIDEFYTVKTIVDDIDLATIQVMGGMMAALQHDEIGSDFAPNQGQQYNQGNNYQRAPQGTSLRRVNTAPRYNNPTNTYNNNKQEEETQDVGYQRGPSQVTRQPYQNPQPSRGPSIMNTPAIENIEIDDSFEDDALNDVFNSEDFD